MNTVKESDSVEQISEKKGEVENTMDMVTDMKLETGRCSNSWKKACDKKLHSRAVTPERGEAVDTQQNKQKASHVLLLLNGERL